MLYHSREFDDVIAFALPESDATPAQLPRRHHLAFSVADFDGFLDGVPEVGDQRRFRSWRRIVARERSRHRLALRRGEDTLLHAYGATSTVEFFAEATEVFFERPRRLRKTSRSLYAALRRFYGQDPARRR